MSQHLCEQCGAANAADAQFCVKCDFYLGWDTGSGRSRGGAPLTSGVPIARESHTQKIALGRRPPPSRPVQRQPPPPRPLPPSSPNARSATAPQATLTEPEVHLDPNDGGAFDIRIHNTSSIVDGYTVVAPKAPPWLQLSHDEIRLLTDQEVVGTVKVGIDARFIVNVQRFVMRLQVCSVEDPRKRTDVDLVVIVARTGGPVTITAEPPVVRLRDQSSGRFAVRLDNRASNYPQRYGLYGKDSEGVVRFTFQQPVVEIPARRDQVVQATFHAPPPEPGQQLNRTLTITAASDEGGVEAVINVFQQTSLAPQDSPVQVRLEPAVTRLTDRTSAEISVLVDNRRGTKDKRLMLAGRDPEGRIRFSFSQQQLYIRAGEKARVLLHLNAPLPRPGEQTDRPFSVVCNDGIEEREAGGNLVQSASDSPMTTAQVRLEPEHVVVRNRSRGRFRVTVDNVRGNLPLRVSLSGSDPESAAQFTFSPPGLEIPPGTVAYSDLQVQANRPDSGEAIEREIKVTASDGVSTAEAKGRFSQSSSDMLPIARLCLTLLGGAMVAGGCFAEWFINGPLFRLPQLASLKEDIDAPQLVDPNTGEIINKEILFSQEGGRALILLLAGVMLLGILSAKGRVTVVSSFLAGMLMIGYSIYAYSEWTSGGPAYGAVLIIVGAIIGIIGGFCIRRST